MEIGAGWNVVSVDNSLPLLQKLQSFSERNLSSVKPMCLNLAVDYPYGIEESNNRGRGKRGKPPRGSDMTVEQNCSSVFELLTTQEKRKS